MGMTQTSGLQRTTRYSIYRRYVPRPTTRRTLSNQSGGSSGASQTPRRNSLNSEHAEEESDIPLTNKNQSLREHVLRSSVDKMRLLRRGGNVTFDEVKLYFKQKRKGLYHWLVILTIHRFYIAPNKQ